MEPMYVEKGGQRLRQGYTTGSCAAAAAKAAAQMLLSGEEVHQVRILTPRGIPLTLEIEEICFHRTSGGGTRFSAEKGNPVSENGDSIPESGDRIPESGCRIPESGDRIPESGCRIPESGDRIPESGDRIPESGDRIPESGDRIPESGDCIPESRQEPAEKEKICAVSCAVRKDSGDDPDVTNGALIYAMVAFSDMPEIRIDGGDGVGRVTKPGLDQPVGAAAINSTPRRMIREAVLEAVRMNRGQGEESGAGFDVTISVPAGKELARKTFNPKLGIVDGISILGTSGIVDPMSDEALLNTIRVEINVRREEGWTILPAAPGNYGRNFFLENYGFSLDTAVESSNFIYDTVRMAQEAGFTRMLFVGHIGKLVKVAGGIRNTHSRFGDHRMEILGQIADGFCPGMSRKLEGCVSTDEAVRILREFGIDGKEGKGLDALVLEEMTRRIQAVMEEWADHTMQIEVVVFSNVFGELGKTAGAGAYMRELRER